MRQTALKPQDVLLLLKLVAASPSKRAKLATLADELGFSQAEISAARRRSVAAGLLRERVGSTTVDRAALDEFLIHGLRYVFPAQRGALTRGIPTSYAAPPLNRFIANPAEPPPVWPYAEGNVRGFEFTPIYKSVPEAASRDPKLYELLALVDALRDSRVRERDFAARELRARLETTP
jgi:hypothetical protein